MPITLELTSYNQLAYLDELLKKEKLRYWEQLPYKKKRPIMEISRAFDKFWKAMSRAKQPCCEEQILGTLSKIVNNKVNEINGRVKHALGVTP